MTCQEMMKMNEAVNLRNIIAPHFYNTFNSKRNTYPYPTDKQFYYLDMLYKYLNTQQQQTTGATSLDITTIGDTDLLNAIDWAITNPNKMFDAKTIDILKTIKSKLTVSKRQSKYLVNAYAEYMVQKGN